MMPSVLITINTDNDFHVRIYRRVIRGQDFFTIKANTPALVRQKAIRAFQTATLPYVKTWGVIENNTVARKGDYSGAWIRRRDEVVQKLVDGNTSIRVGGNQFIEVQFYD